MVGRETACETSAGTVYSSRELLLHPWTRTRGVCCPLFFWKKLPSFIVLSPANHVPGVKKPQGLLALPAPNCTLPPCSPPFFSPPGRPCAGPPTRSRPCDCTFGCTGRRSPA